MVQVMMPIKLSYVIVACGNLHALTAKDVARSYQYGITEQMCAQPIKPRLR